MLVIGSLLVYELVLLAGSIYLGGWFYSIGILSVMLVPKFNVQFTCSNLVLYWDQYTLAVTLEK